MLMSCINRCVVMDFLTFSLHIFQAHQRCGRIHFIYKWTSRRDYFLILLKLMYKYAYGSWKQIKIGLQSYGF